MENSDKKAAFDVLAEIAKNDPELVEKLRAYGMAYGWKFVGRALTGWTFEKLTAERN